MSVNQPNKPSPRWNSVTKTIAGFTLIAALAGLLIHFQSIIPQLLMIVILAYLVNPVANLVKQTTHLPWKASVGFVFLLLVVIYISLITWSGVSVVKQILNLVELMRISVTELPNVINEILSAPIQIGPFQIDLSGYSLASFDQQIMQASQSVILMIADGLAKFGRIWLDERLLGFGCSGVRGGGAGGIVPGGRGRGPSGGASPGACPSGPARIARKPTGGCGTRPPAGSDSPRR